MIHAILPVALTKTLTITYKKFNNQIPRFPSAVNGLSPPVTHLQVLRIETTHWIIRRSRHETFRTWDDTLHAAFSLSPSTRPGIDPQDNQQNNPNNAHALLDLLNRANPFPSSTLSTQFPFHFLPSISTLHTLRLRTSTKTQYHSPKASPTTPSSRNTDT